MKYEFENWNLIASVDTVSIKTTDKISIIPKGVTVIRIVNDITTFKVNPNTFIGKEIYTFTEYVEVMNRILVGMNVKEFWYSRIDIRFDSYWARYEEVSKINRLLILLYYFDNQTTYNIYQSKNGWNQKDLSFCFRGNSTEIESYNKEEQESRGMILSRLECRRIRITKPIRQQDISRQIIVAIDFWKEKLLNCLWNYEEMQKQLNGILVEKYWEGMDKGVYNTLNDFIQTNIAYIFSAKQMDDLFMQVGIEKPTLARYNFVKRHKALEVDFITKKEIRLYVKYLITQMERFERNSQT